MCCNRVGENEDGEEKTLCAKSAKEDLLLQISGIADDLSDEEDDH